MGAEETLGRELTIDQMRTWCHSGLFKLSKLPEDQLRENCNLVDQIYKMSAGIMLIGGILVFYGFIRD
ncbi:MAG: hypothetical protein ACE5PM_08895 [Candidatus Hydrothermarchaeales archaeon]